MNISNIAELIILQSIEDLWNKKEKSESSDFFTGEGFSLCAGLADMGPRDRERLLNMVGKAIQQNPGTVSRPEGNLPVLRLRCALGKVLCSSRIL